MAAQPSMVLLIEQLSDGTDTVCFVKVTNPQAIGASTKPRLARLEVDNDMLSGLNEQISTLGIGKFSVKEIAPFGKTLVFTPNKTKEFQFVYPDHVGQLLRPAVLTVFKFVQLRVLMWNKGHTDFNALYIEPDDVSWYARQDGVDYPDAEEWRVAQLTDEYTAGS